MRFMVIRDQVVPVCGQMNPYQAAGAGARGAAGSVTCSGATAVMITV